MEWLACECVQTGGYNSNHLYICRSCGGYIKGTRFGMYLCGESTDVVLSVGNHLNKMMLEDE